jgi:two-component system sensor histidine kinase CpxA
MRSIVVRILAGFFAIGLLSVIAVRAATYYVISREGGPGGFAGRLGTLQCDEAQHAFDTGGRAELANYFDRLSRYFPDRRRLVDASNRDVITGVDLGAELSRASERPAPSLLPFPRPLLLVATSSDGRHRLLVTASPPHAAQSLLPYYGWILALTAVLCCALALHLTLPLRRLRQTVERFGRGDLAVRSRSTRQDEIGDVARAFDAMADRLESLLGAQRRLLQDVSHELRSPLTRLEFALEIARTSADRDAPWQRIRRDVDRLREMVEALLQVTRAEAGALSPQFEPVSLVDLVALVVDDCRIEAESRGCRIALVSTADVTVMADAELLRRAVENVVRNAVNHAPSGSVVEVGCRVAQAVVTVEVRDHGAGVPEPLLADLFKPFFRVESDRDRLTGGVGLGLSIAQRAVMLHHGRIEAANAKPGLCVSIELPVG